MVCRHGLWAHGVARVMGQLTTISRLSPRSGRAPRPILGGRLMGKQIDLQISREN